jgi:hypothetical protein
MTLAYTTFAIACGTIYLVLTRYVIQMAFVFHPDFPGGPLMYEAIVLSPQAPFVIAVILMAMLDWLTLGIQVCMLTLR